MGLDIALELKRIAPLKRHAQMIAVAQEDHPLWSAAQVAHGIDERLQHRVEIERRAADDLEHVRRRRLLRERFLQVARASLNLVEQPRVLDRDRRLVGECSSHLDLAVGNAPGWGRIKKKTPSTRPACTSGTPISAR